MKINATFQCGHDATRSFDGRNMGQRWAATEWGTKAAARPCPDCLAAARVARVQSMSASEMRTALLALVVDGQRAAMELVEAS